MATLTTIYNAICMQCSKCSRVQLGVWLQAEQFSEIEEFFLSKDKENYRLIRVTLSKLFQSESPRLVEVLNLFSELWLEKLTIALYANTEICLNHKRVKFDQVLRQSDTKLNSISLPNCEVLSTRKSSIDDCIQFYSLEKLKDLTINT
jgi:hypothetical protein